MRITSTLTRYEARAGMRLPTSARIAACWMSAANSGEFILQLCRRHPSCGARLLDLPLVCEIGMEHLLASRSMPGIGFLRRTLRTDPLPAATI